MVGEGPLTTPVSELSAPELLSTPSPRGPIWGLWAWRRGGYYGAERGFRIKAEARAEKKRLKLAAQDAAAANLASPETTVRTKTGAKDWASQVGVDPWPKGEAPKPTKSAGVAKPYQIQVTEYPRRRRANGKRVVEYLSDFNDGTAPLIKKSSPARWRAKSQTSAPYATCRRRQCKLAVRRPSATTSPPA